MLTVFGSVALDTIQTPKKTLNDRLGGAAVYAAISANNFTRPGLIAVVGSDLPPKYRDILVGHMDLDGLTTKLGRTFRYGGRYDDTLSSRTTLKTELNVLEGFEPDIPDMYASSSRFVYLANNDPDQNRKVLDKFDGVRFSMCDTIDFWINTKRSTVVEMFKSVDAVVINDQEARLLTKEHNLIRCARAISKECGVQYIIIKKGEHGSLLFYKDEIISAPAYPLENPVDPTGAGDSFAGAIMGYLASRDREVTVDELRKGIIYGSVMGSFAVQGYGVDGLLDIEDDEDGPAAIQERVDRYTKWLPC